MLQSWAIPEVAKTINPRLCSFSRFSFAALPGILSPHLSSSPYFTYLLHFIDTSYTESRPAEIVEGYMKGL